MSLTAASPAFPAIVWIVVAVFAFAILLGLFVAAFVLRLVALSRKRRRRDRRRRGYVSRRSTADGFGDRPAGGGPYAK